MMIPCNIKEVAEYFNTIWPEYKDYVAQNGLCHRELLAALDQFLHEQLAGRSFSFVDVGCGDGSVIINTLLNHSIKKYIGIDVAYDILQMAPLNLAPLNCEKEFITNGIQMKTIWFEKGICQSQEMNIPNDILKKLHNTID